MIRYTHTLRKMIRKRKTAATAYSFSTQSTRDSFGMYWSGLAAVAGWAVTLSTLQTRHCEHHQPSLQMTQDIAVFSSILALLSWNSSWLFRCHLLNVFAIVGATTNPISLFAPVDPLLRRFRTSDWQCRGEVGQPGPSRTP